MKILIVYYSLYGHTLKLARAAEQGASQIENAEVIFRRVREFPETEVDMPNHPHADKVWQQQKDTPECTLDDLKAADGIIFASPTRFGNMIAQMKRLFDSCASLWMEGALEGKPAGVLTSTASTHGGQETTLVSMMIPILHLGMVVVGCPYSIDGMIHTEARGATPYGPTTLAGPDNSREPHEQDIEIAKQYGKRFATITAKMTQ
ncbi:NAD(P)H dehydrogenase (quinone) [Anaerohalosphaera lusitana]|uniref:NAD(P)H dehydrogenase (Quinone) n=1 Tax=Anaerohalosphaera lusitana TaxID=1936003 RepID=A0A1U9NHP1_9BACT|nr:NAD(P)H:quinone oxidoreductase [Anaerohalosphaera lusitana]AQT67452.1 NAD(P)H dehydrogenase (quinone) [Anaerohalosphaera lusitana]